MKHKLITPPHSVPLKEQINRYLHDTVYMLLLALTAAGSYGFLISHYSVSTDDLLYRYYYYGGLISQGRFTGSLVERLFHLTDNFIWIQDFIGIVFLCFAAILLCAFFDSYYQTKSRAAQTFFSCLLVSYPLHATLFVYGGCSLAFGAGLTMTVGALFLIRHCIETKKLRFVFPAIILLIFTASWYESVLILYVQAVLAALLLFQLKTKRLKLSELLVNGLFYALPLVVAVISEFILSKILMAVLRVSPSTYTANQAFSLDFSDKAAFLDQLNYVIMGNYLRTAVQALFSFPLLVFGAASLGLLLAGLICGIRKKSAPLFWTVFVLTAANFVLPLFMGKVALRTCQPFAFTVAFAAFLVCDSVCGQTKKPRQMLGRLALIGMACLLVGQTAQTSKLFTTDDLRYQQERAIVVGVGNYLLEHDLDHKPIVFVGQVDFNDNVKSRTCVRKDNKLFRALLKVPGLGAYCGGLAAQRSDDYAFPRLDGFCLSYINHAMTFEDAYSEITLFFHYCGFDTIRYGTPQQQKAAQQYAADLPAWPHQGACKDLGDFVVVNLGESAVNGF